jgi:hypothetical protein
LNVAMSEVGIGPVIVTIDVARATCFLARAFRIVVLFAVFEQSVAPGVVVGSNVCGVVLRSEASALGAAGISRLLEV